MSSINPTPIGPTGAQVPYHEAEKVQEGKAHGKIYTKISNALKAVSDTLEKIKNMLSGEAFKTYGPHYKEQAVNQESLKQLHVMIIGAKNLIENPQKKEKALSFKELHNLDLMTTKLNQSITTLGSKLTGVEDKAELDQAKKDIEDLSSILHQKQAQGQQKMHAAMEKKGKVLLKHKAERKKTPGKIDKTSGEYKKERNKISKVLKSKVETMDVSPIIKNDVESLIDKAFAVKFTDGKSRLEKNLHRGLGIDLLTLNDLRAQLKTESDPKEIKKMVNEVLVLIERGFTEGTRTGVKPQLSHYQEVKIAFDKVKEDLNNI